MSHWRSGTFWARAIFVWFVTIFVFSYFVVLFKPQNLFPGMAVVVLCGFLLVPSVVAYAYARWRFESRKPKQVGFPVIAKGGDNSEAV